jgi:hypothetical protein
MVVEFMLCMGLGLILFVAFANLAVDTVLQGVAHSAVDQGVRAGARVDVDSVSTCEARARQVLDNFPGPASTGASLSCGDDGDVVTAHITMSLPSWVPMVSASTVDVTGQARKERT